MDIKVNLIYFLGMTKIREKMMDYVRKTEKRSLKFNTTRGLKKHY